MSEPTIDGLDDDEALQLIAEHINAAGDHGNMALASTALALADALEERGVSDEDLAVLDYFRANAWDARYRQRLGARARVWDWDQPEVREQIFLLRKALNNTAFGTLHPMYRCQILTNLANQFDKIGRFVEAQAIWTRALGIDPDFWMARANRGNGLMFYVGTLYDPGHQSVLALHAHRDLTDAVEQIPSFPDLGDVRLAPQFASHAGQIASHFDLEAVRTRHDSDGWSLGETPEEQSYRRWCLQQVLFLNPLNDVERKPVAAQDILGLPSFTLDLDSPPIVIGMANELKQGFASARWLLYEGMHSDAVHFSDRDVLLFNTLDYPAYGLSVEKVKLAFRMAYSSLDKIAYFLNFYFELGIPQKKVSFRTIWRDKENGPVRDVFVQSENWPWRGLFWLGKDLFDEDMRDTTEPDARALAELRNHLEHKYVKVHDMGPPLGSPDDPLFDRLAHAISRADLEQRTLKLLQLVRAALIYLFLGMHRNERARARGKTGRLSGMPLDAWRDEWKR